MCTVISESTEKIVLLAHCFFVDTYVKLCIKQMYEKKFNFPSCSFSPLTVDVDKEKGQITLTEEFSSKMAAATDGGMDSLSKKTVEHLENDLEKHDPTILGILVAVVIGIISICEYIYIIISCE